MALPYPEPPTYPQTEPGSPLHGLLRHHRSAFQGLYVEALQGRELAVDQHTIIDFATGAYLGLDLDLTDGDIRSARTWGLRNGWSRATGATALTATLESELARTLQMDDVRLATSAALINYSSFHALKDGLPIAIYDRDAHITLKQGILAAYPSRQRHSFANNDPKALEAILKRLPLEERKVVAVDGVYSMKGSEAPVEDLLAVCKRYNAWLFIDDVHGFGVRGPNGLGVIERIQPADRKHVLLLASFAKSASNPVAFLAFPTDVPWAKAAEGFNYSGPPSNLHVAVCLRHLRAFKEYEVRRTRLLRASERLHAFCEGHGIRTLSAAGSPIVSVCIQDAPMEATVARLRELGIVGKVAVYPVVQRGDEVLRFTLTAAHTARHLHLLEEALLDVQPALRVRT